MLQKCGLTIDRHKKLNEKGEEIRFLKLRAVQGSKNIVFNNRQIHLRRLQGSTVIEEYFEDDGKDDEEFSDNENETLSTKKDDDVVMREKDLIFKDDVKKFSKKFNEFKSKDEVEDIVMKEKIEDTPRKSFFDDSWSFKKKSFKDQGSQTEGKLFPTEEEYWEFVRSIDRQLQEEEERLLTLENILDFP